MKKLKRTFWVLATLLILINVVAFFHAQKFTHFSNEKFERTKDPKDLNIGQKIKTLIFGVKNPRPENKLFPTREYQTINLQSNKKIECWHVQVKDPKGTIILFHGFSDSKSSLLDKSEVFNELGYNTFLVDFMGSGGSEGNRTTAGFSEAKQVETCFNYLLENAVENIYLFGTSMGAVAIMKAIHDYGINPKGIIIECPFGSMYQTVCARFKLMNLPTFPMAGLLVFWGGVQNGFWAFSHNPTQYAKKINCPALLLYGKKDEKVSRQEVDIIFNNLMGMKNLVVYPETGHENYLHLNKEQWIEDIKIFFTTSIFP